MTNKSEDLIRNFCIIAHIDHGKSTLADRFLEMTNAISEREKKEQFLDQMELERERGITIKAQTVHLEYLASDKKKYQLNLIDTPGHVDFHYEVSRSLKACEGALLLVDAAQGVQAQTLANALMAIDQGLELIPVINKIDLPSADVEGVRLQIEEVLGLDGSKAIAISAKTSQGVKDVLEAVVRDLPPPKGRIQGPARALIFDSWFDSYQGVIILVRVVDGVLKKNSSIRLMNAAKDFEVQKLGFFKPQPFEVSELKAGQVGFCIAGIKEVADAKVGDTVTTTEGGAIHPLPDFKEVKPMVFAGLYPVTSDDYEGLKIALEKLRLNDAAFNFEPETSVALGFGFRCGFLGSLHMEIIQERLEREYDVDLITTAPTVVYRVDMPNGKQIEVDNPAKLPPPQEREAILEPFARVQVHSPAEFIGGIISLCEKCRGIQENIQYFGTDRVMICYRLPFSEMMFHFFDQLKSISKGYASLDYDLAGYEKSDLVKLNMLINSEPVDALSVIVHRESAYYKGRELALKLKELIPRQQFEIAIQASLGNKVIARESVRALRKDVTAKCYGGDVSRKRKLLEKQKEGKKRMKQVGKIEIPQEAFLSVLKVK